MRLGSRFFEAKEHNRSNLTPRSGFNGFSSVNAALDPTQSARNSCFGDTSIPSDLSRCSEWECLH